MLNSEKWNMQHKVTVCCYLGDHLQRAARVDRTSFIEQLSDVGSITSNRDEGATAYLKRHDGAILRVEILKSTSLSKSPLS